MGVSIDSGWQVACARLALGVVLAAVTATAMAALPAQAQSVAVLGLASEDGSDEAARAVTDALREQAGATLEWQLNDAQPLLTQMTLAHDCEIRDAACRTAIGEGLGAQQVIYGTASGAPASESLHVELMMFESAQGSILGVAARDIPMTALESGLLRSHVKALLDELRGVRPQPESAAAAPTSDPAVASDAEPVAEPLASAEPSGGGSTGQWVGYGLLGTAAVSLGLAVYSWTQISSAQDTPSFMDYRRRVGEDPMGVRVEDVCEEAEARQSYGLSAAQLDEVREQCDSGRTFELLQYVFLGAAAVSGGVGLYLVLSDDDEERSAADRVHLVLSPRVGRDRAGLSATLRF